MPELPEVETTRRGIEPLLLGRDIVDVIFRTPKLRQPLPAKELLMGQRLLSVHRRGKYLLIEGSSGWLIIHLGMSGHLRVIPAQTPPCRHDHVDLVLDDGACLRLNDTRRFGALLWTAHDPSIHPLLAGLGCEPLAQEFDGAYLFERSRNCKRPIKVLLMDQRIVVGVGNIYANEALFLAGIHPQARSGSLSLQRCERLTGSIRQVLEGAIVAGGTTLRDFTRPDGRPGYFEQHLQVYGRAGEDCLRCPGTVHRQHQGGRSTYYCSQCQKR